MAKTLLNQEIRFCLTGFVGNSKIWGMGLKSKFLVAFLLACMLPYPLLAGRKAPNFKLKNLDGKYISLDSLLKRGPVILDFWATWCTYCDEELDLLNELQKEFQNLVTVVAISIDNPRVAVFVGMNRLLKE